MTRNWCWASALMCGLAVAAGPLEAADVQVFHADSLAGPMGRLKAAFEARHAGARIVLTSGVSRQLAERIVKGEVVDVFAPSSPAVIDEDLLDKPVRAGPAVSIDSSSRSASMSRRYRWAAIQRA